MAHAFVNVGAFHNVGAASYSSFEVLNSSLVSRSGAAAAQPGGSLKGAHTHMQRKAAGVQHDAGQQGLGFQRGDVILFGQELQQFTHQFAGTGGVRLVVEQQRVVDMADRHAVVIDDNNALALFVDFLAFQQALLVGIHHDQQRAGRDNIQRLVRRDEVVSLACIE